MWVWVASDNDDHVRSIRTIVLHKLENVEEDGDQMVRKQQQRDEEERRSRRAELARPRAPEPNGIDNHSVINQLFESLNTITNQLQSTVELSSSLQAPHAVAQDTISNFESQVTLFDSIVRASQGQECPASPIIEPTLPCTYPQLRPPILHLFLATARKCFMRIVGCGWACHAS